MIEISWRSLGALAISLASVSIIGCSNSDDAIYQAFKCAKMASTMGLGQKAVSALEKVKPQLEKAQKNNPGGAAPLLEKLNNRLLNEMRLDKLNGPQQAEAIVRVVASAQCEKIYR